MLKNKQVREPKGRRVLKSTVAWSGIILGGAAGGMIAGVPGAAVGSIAGFKAADVGFKLPKMMKKKK